MQRILKSTECRLEGSPALHHQVESALAAAVNPVGVVQLARAVNAQADEKMMFLEERAPVIVEQQAVGLEGVLHDLFGPAVGFNEFHRTLEEVELHQRRLATLPRHRDLLGAMRFEQLADVGLERGLGHPALFVRIQCLLGQEEAIGAINIAGGPARLRQQVEGRWGAQGFGRHVGVVNHWGLHETKQHGKKSEYADKDENDCSCVKRSIHFLFTQACNRNESFTPQITNHPPVFIN